MSPSSLQAFALSALSGGLLAAAFPGTGGQGWLAFGALVPLLVAIEGAPWRRAAGLGFAAGLVFWLATIPWVASTMMRYGGLPWPLASLFLLMLGGYLALYWGAFCALLSRCPLRSGGLYVIVAASLWVALEFLRTYLLTGFPWNLLGYSQHRNLPLIQMAAVAGVYGVSFIVMAANAALARTLLRRKHWRGFLAPLGTAALLMAGALGYGWLQPWPEAGNSPVKRPVPVALVQGNIGQDVKWDPAWQDRTLSIYRELTLEAARNHPQLIVWPEAAVPFLLQEDPRLAQIESLTREAGAYLLVGAPDWQAGQPRNTAFLFGPDGRMLGRYDKRHLVPFGEYVPLARLLFFVDPLAGGAIGQFAPGREATVFSTPIGRFSVVICYEAIFPDEVREFFLGGADVLVNITNDAWFGRSAASAQHLAMAAFRAVENRAYLLRAANTGISAIVAPDGRIVQASGLFTPAILSAAIMPRIGISFYTRYGDLFAWGTVAVALAMVLAPLVALRLPTGRRLKGPLPLGGSLLSALSANFAAGCVGLFAPLGVAITALGLDWLHRWTIQEPILYGAAALSLTTLAHGLMSHRQPLLLGLGLASVGALLYPLHEAMDVTVFRLLLNGGAAGLLGAAVWNALLLRRLRAAQWRPDQLREIIR